MELDIFGQQPFLFRLYTQLTLCYAFPASGVAAAREHLLATLRTGLERLSRDFPWTAGRVVDEGGVYVIEPFREKITLAIQDCSNELDWHELVEKKFPMELMREEALAPCMTLGGCLERADGSGTDAPVFAVQVTFVRGGMLLTVAGQHNAMDMSGQGLLMEMLSRACYGEAPSPEEIAAGNVDRAGVIPLLPGDAYKECRQLERQVARGAPLMGAPSTWVYFSFSGESCRLLTTEASKHLGSSARFVSTDDAISAFVWQAVARARAGRIGPATATTLARAVNARPFLNVSALYLGVALNMVYSTSTVGELAAQPLGTVASQLRESLESEAPGIGFNTSALATLMVETKDKSTVSVTATVDPSTDVMLSSWSKVNAYSLDFNLGLGAPVAVRRPHFLPLESLMYLMPRASDGEISLAMSLRSEDLANLKSDPIFTKFASYIG